tara:strand:- start:1177 stop:1419 length:243 start_codon:yes stop_codon:yes gene_type:complete
MESGHGCSKFDVIYKTDTYHRLSSELLVGSGVRLNLALSVLLILRVKLNLQEARVIKTNPQALANNLGRISNILQESIMH